MTPSRKSSSKAEPAPALADPDGLYYFDAKAADWAVEFIESGLRHVKGEKAGQPMLLDDWQKLEVIRPFFGWKRQADGSRRYRTLYLEVPRKNGKSTLIAAIGLLLLFADGEKGAEIYSAAADKEQAAIVFQVAKGMIDQNPHLIASSLTVRHNVSVARTGSFYRVLSADAYTKHGLNAHGILFDELHAQPNRELFDVLTTSVGSRTQPAVFLITTAGVRPKAATGNVCWEMHEHALKVAAGNVRDDTFLPVVYAADESDDWTDPVWAKCNPGLGSSIRLDYLKDACERAKSIPGYENTFKRLHLNLWTEQDTRWIQMEKWDECGEDYDEDSLAGQPCYAALDLANRNDLAALALVFPVGNTYRVLTRFWCPQKRIAERARRDRVPYDQWCRDRHITATPGDAIDNEFIRAEVLALGAKFKIREVAFDPWAATETSIRLQDEGVKMVEYRQGFRSMSEPTKNLYSLILEGRFTHNRNPVLRWMAGNAAVSQDAAGNLKPDKEKSSDKIDGVVAVIMAIGRATVDKPVAESVYKSRGLFTA